MRSQGSQPTDVLSNAQRGTDRRSAVERRQRTVPVANERRSGEDRRQQGDRRRQVHLTTCAHASDDQEIDCATSSEVHDVLRSLGLRKVDRTALPGLKPEEGK